MTRRSLIAAFTAGFLISLAGATIAQAGPVKVFILAGQSNMEGKAKVSLLEYQIGQPETKREFEHLQKDGKWVVRPDVWIKFLDRKGNLTVGFGSPDRIGPELEFGNVVGDHYEDQVLIIKTAWGGKSLFRDFRPPSSGEADAKILEEMLANLKKKTPDATLDDVKKPFGVSYRLMLEEVSSTLAELKKHFPDYQGQGYEIAGFVWFQGWNDMINADYTAEYAKNMANFIRDVRKDLKTPNLPFVIGQLGVGGVNEDPPNPRKQTFKDAQAAAAELPEFKGNVKVVKTDVFWDPRADAVFKKGWRENLQEWEKVGSDYPFHYLGSPHTFCQIGKAFGKAVLALQK
jgi:alpha-galactosidase